jgi:hypothetical protein
MFQVLEGGKATQDESSFIVPLRAVVKARQEGAERLVEVEASVAEEDSEGDLITQKALIDSAPSFLATGHLDIDHYSELGIVLGIPDPMSWIVGRPVEVVDGGGGRTMVRGIIKTHPQGSNPDRNKFDAFWESLICQPPVLWRASVFGIMGADTVDCRKEPVAGGPSRFLVQSFDWKSLAFTRNPVNQGIKGYAHIVSAKSHVEGLLKSRPFGSSLPGWGALKMGVPAQEEQKAAGWVEGPQRPSMEDVRHMESCPTCGGLRSAPSLPMWRGHFSKCMGMGPDDANTLAHAAMYQHLVEKGGAAAMPLMQGVPPVEGPGNWDLNQKHIRRRA